MQTVVTSPPYWSLRDYAVESQIGRDDTLSDYIGSIVAAFVRIPVESDHRIRRKVISDSGGKMIPFAGCTGQVQGV